MDPMDPSRRYDGLTAIVTGGGSGIGAATARRLAREGATVVVADIDEAAATAVAASIGSDGGAARPVTADVADPAAWDRMIEATAGGVDLLVTSAFTVRVAPLLEQTPEDWARQMRVNLDAAYFGLSACLPSLRERSGAVVLISSVHALIGLPGHPAYAATKGALIALARQVATDYGPAVRVNSILPGPIDTPNWANTPEAERARFAGQTVAGRLGRAEEVAAAVAFLGSRDASYITGQTLVVDGGWSISR